MRQLILSLFLLTATSCASFHPTTSTDIHLWHIVIVHLNHPGDPTDRQKLIDATKTFRHIKGVQLAYVGTVLPTTRPHVDATFDVGIIMGFKTPEDMAAYVNDPLHQKAVAEVLKPLAKDYTIYDFTND